jgi:transcriptional regulator with XRE-family HTH domain
VTTRRRTLAQAIGLHLQRERVARGLTQRRLAEQHGVSQSWLARFELGQSRTSLDRVAELFAAFGLQLRVELEPLGADLDDEIVTYGRMSDEERLDVISYFDRSIGYFDGLQFALTGRLAAFVQGAPVAARILDFAVAEEDLEGYLEVFERHCCLRWSDGWMDWGWGPMDPREPGPMRWRLGIGDELRLHVTKDRPRTVIAKAGGRELPVVPLADLELAFPDIARVMQRWRSGLGAATRGQHSEAAHVAAPEATCANLEA